MKKVKIFALLSIIVLLSACASKGGTLENPMEMNYLKTANKCLVGAGTVGTSADASFTYSEKYCPDNFGNLVEVTSGGSFSDTVAGRVSTTLLGATVPSIVHGYSAIEAAKESGCKGDCGNIGFSLNNGASADSLSESIADGNSTSNSSSCSGSDCNF